MKQKLSTLLALCQDRQAKYRAMLKDYVQYFAKNQGDFMGRLHTYASKDPDQDDDTMRKNDKVVTSPTEKLNYFTAFNQQFFQDILSKERTNGSGVAKGVLKVGGIEVEMTSGELLCLKGLVDTEIKNLLSIIPTRPEKNTWTKTEGLYTFDVWGSELTESVKRTTLKEAYILEDPNLTKLKDTSGYKPVTNVKDTPIILGTGTRQEFHSGWSQLEKAQALSRFNEIQDAITVALHQANDVEVVATSLDTNKLFSYLFFGN